MRQTHSYDADGNQVGPVVEGPDGAELYLHAGRWHLASPAGESEIESQQAEDLARSWGEELPA